MKRLTLMAFCLMATAMMAVKAAPVKKSSTMKNNGCKMVVISDIHLLAPDLFDNGEASQRLASGDMKLVLQSDLIMQRMVDEIIAQKPQLMLITGDLTLNGSRASHERLISHLRRM